MFLSKESEQSFGASYCRAIKEGEAGTESRVSSLSSRAREVGGPLDRALNRLASGLID